MYRLSPSQANTVAWWCAVRTSSRRGEPWKFSGTTRIETMTPARDNAREERTLASSLRSLNNLAGFNEASRYWLRVRHDHHQRGSAISRSLLLSCLPARLLYLTSRPVLEGTRPTTPALMTRSPPAACLVRRVGKRARCGYEPACGGRRRRRRRPRTFIDCDDFCAR